MPAHAIVSIEDLVREKGLSTAQTLMLCTLWLRTRNPFDDQPVVVAKHEEIARVGDFTEDYVRKLTKALEKRGCIRRLGHSRAGTSYALLRPEHTDADDKRNPFGPSESEVAAEEVLEILIASGRVAAPKVKAKRGALPPVEPRLIACRLQEVAGIPTKIVNGVEIPSLPYSAKAGDPSAVRAAQRFIVEHGEEEFTGVCKLASTRELTYRNEPLSTEQRLHLFDYPKIVKAIRAELLAAPVRKPEPSKPAVEAPTQTASECTPLAVQAPAEITEEMRRRYWGMKMTDAQIRRQEGIA